MKLDSTNKEWMETLKRISELLETKEVKEFFKLVAKQNKMQRQALAELPNFTEEEKAKLKKEFYLVSSLWMGHFMEETDEEIKGIYDELCDDTANTGLRSVWFKWVTEADIF